MDGLSIMYAYAEYLRKTGNNADYYFEGSLKKEAKIILEYFHIKSNNCVDIDNNDEIIIVDTNSLRELSTKIKKDKIIEIIDHHK